MAEIISSKNRKTSPRIDFTPMVDLGFLLITFFVMTSRLNEPMTMDVQMPIEGGTPSEIPDFTAMTIFLGNNHKLYYFTGADAMNNVYSNLKTTSFGKDGIRDALMKHGENVKLAIANGLKGSSSKDHPFILIKAGSESQYSDLVDVLDELAISNIHDYALMDIEQKEELVIKEKG